MTGALALGVGVTGSAAADASNNPAMPGRIYAADRLFATRGLTDLPPPNGRNDHSFDELYVFEDPVAAGQYAVAEAAPGERDFDGGRWSVTRIEWTENASPTLLTNDGDVRAHIADGDLTVLERGAMYFECPLVPLSG